MSEGTSGGGFRLFGRSVNAIPCYRESLMNGIGGGILTGLGFFLFTSQIRRATNFGFASFVGCTLVSWGVCRSKMRVIDENAIKKALQEKILSEGKSLESHVRENAQDV